jgi:hypothetical protein
MQHERVVSLTIHDKPVAFFPFARTRQAKKVIDLLFKKVLQPMLPSFELFKGSATSNRNKRLDTMPGVTLSRAAGDMLRRHPFSSSCSPAFNLFYLNR